jgi:uncharacterized protein (DUF4415 family)
MAGRKVIFDDDNPEWTAEDFARAKPAREMLPPEILAQFRNMRGRPLKDASERKVAVSIRLSPDVLAHFRAGGPGWQSRIDEALRRVVKRARKAG